MHPFLKALSLVDQGEMADALGVTKQRVSKMKKLAEADPCYLVPSNHLRGIERVTGGRVTVQDLVMDVPPDHGGEQSSVQAGAT